MKYEVFLLHLLSSAAEIETDQLPNKLEALNDLGIDHPVLRNLAIFGIAVIAAPLLEELVFRFPLKYRRGSLGMLCVSVYGVSPV